MTDEITPREMAKKAAADPDVQIMLDAFLARAGVLTPAALKANHPDEWALLVDSVEDLLEQLPLADTLGDHE